MRGKKSSKKMGAKPPKANALAGTSNYVAKAAGFATGGAVAAAPAPAAPTRAARARGGMCAPMQGSTSMRRLDRPGRKRGGSVGADTSPLTSANSLSSGNGGDGP